jgi:hypothetical protein
MKQLVQAKEWMPHTDMRCYKRLTGSRARRSSLAEPLERFPAERSHCSTVFPQRACRHCELSSSILQIEER